MEDARKTSLIPEDAYESGAQEGTLGAEEELWLAHPETFKLAGGAQKILANAPEGHFSGELIDCEIESNSEVHPTAAGVAENLNSRRQYLSAEAEGLDRLLGASGTHPIGDFREQAIIDQPHYRSLEEKLGWLIRRNNTFSLHVHYAVSGKERAIYLYNRLREYVPHMLAVSANSPFWQGEPVDQHSARAFVFSRGVPRAGMPEAFANWFRYAEHLDLLYNTGQIAKMGEIWWDIRPHPVLGTMEIRAFDAQTDASRNEALITLTAALCESILSEYDSGELRPILPVREIEENKWSAQQYGLGGRFLDFERAEAVPTRRAVESLIDWLQSGTRHDLRGVLRLLEDGPESERQLEVYRETGSTKEVVRDLAERTASR
ncbi:MAG: YbdK family carboxylate-amine ligase [Rubrobacter sp.]|nr:YbdK family carboxylate-amine ligase [Rubrobacter sp.]